LNRRDGTLEFFEDSVVSRVKADPLRDFDGRVLEDALGNDGTLPLDRIVQIVQRFGEALASDDGVPPDVRALMGTPRYWSPEHEEDVPEDAISAQFSLAAIAYHMLTGRPPFGDDGLRTSPDPIRAWRSQIPIELESVVLRAMARDRAHRYPSLPDFVSSFRDAADLRARVTAPDDATTVSAVSSDLAQLLRRGKGQSLFAPRESSAKNDELTVVGRAVVADELTVVRPASASEAAASRPPSGDTLPDPAPSATVSPVAGTVSAPPTRTIQLPWPWGRRRTNSVVVTAGGLVLALGAAVIWRVSASGPTPAPAPPARPAPSPVAIVRPAPPVPAPAPPRSVPRPAEPAAPAASPVAPLAPEPATPPAAAERPGRLRPRAPSKSLSDVNPSAQAASAFGPKNCRISVGSFPWSNVWIDGADTGLQTPVVSLPVSCGRHRLELKRADLKVNQIERVSVTEGIELKRQYDLKGLSLDD
jgi:hypothetical protein